MSNALIKILIFTLILVFYGTLVNHKIELPVRDDLARHIKNGEMILRGHTEVIYKNVYSYVEPSHSFYNHNWLSGILYYLLFSAVGWNGLVIFKIFLFLLTFSILFFTATKKANFWLVAIFSLPTIIMLRERTTLRPEMFSSLFIVIYLYLLIDADQHPERKRIFWLIPLQLLWVNMHLFFIAGIGLVAGFLLEKIILSRKNLTQNILVKKLSLILFLLIAVSFVNPNGAMGALFPFRVFENYGMQVNENQSPFYFLRLYPPIDNISIYAFFVSMVLLGVSFLVAWRKKSLFFTIIAVGTAFAALRMDRLLPLFALVFLPIVAINFSSVSLRLKNIQFERIFTVCFIGLLGYLVFLGGIGAFSQYDKPGIGLAPQSNRSAVFFKEQKLKGPIFNDFDIGSYLIYHLYPDERIFVDNRSEAYSTSFFTETYARVFQDEAAWQQLLDKYNFNVIFLYLYNDSPGARLFQYKRIHDPAWRLVYADSYALILVRNVSINTHIIDKFSISEGNAETALNLLVTSPSVDEQVAAADIYLLLGRTDLGIQTYQQVIKRFPTKGKIWMILGEWELRNNPAKAVEYLKTSISVGNSTAQTYYLLGLAYEKIGEYVKAKDAFTIGNRMNPTHELMKQSLLRFDKQ